MSDLISRQEVSDIIKTRLYQTALNNDEYITSYAKACEDIAENRIDTWINEAKTVEPERKPGKWVHMVGWWECNQCHAEYTDMPTCMGKVIYEYCPMCGTKMEVET